ncbi:two-component regulator propeller domain-containing protein [Ekhidna sp.]|uniref:ligand-binding sensor domain-containing protein n=1 Tax=Ekhidna sp. TaxID=2608089 RepID=UPI0032ECCCF3
MKNILTYLVYLGLSNMSVAQRMEFYRLTQEDGLPSNSVHCIFKDQQGFMWMGTVNGLSRYDGYEFKHYNQQNGYALPDDLINDIFQDSKGLIWIGTNTHGVSILDPKTDSIITFKHNPTNPSSIPGDRVRKIVEDSNGKIWIGFDNGIGLSSLDLETRKAVNYDPFISLERKGTKAIRAIIPDQWRPDTLWLGTTSGLIAFDSKKEEFHVIDHPLEKINRYGLFAAFQPNKSTILGGFYYAGIDEYQIDNGRWNESYSDLSENIRTFDIARKSSTEFWLAVRKKGLAIYDTQSKQIRFIHSDMDNHKSPFPGFTYTVLADEEKLWVGGVNGVSFYDGDAHKFPFVPLNFAQKEYGRITAVTGKYDKIYLAGVHGEGLWEIDKKTKDQRIITKGMPEVVYSMLELEDKVIVIDAGRSLKYLDKVTGQIRTLIMSNMPESGLVMQSIHEWTSEYALILTAYSGVYKLNLETNEVSPLFKINSQNIPRYHNMMIASDQKIWFSTDEDILIYDPKNNSITHFRPESIETKKNQHIYVVREDKNMVKWIGSSNGLIRMEDGKEELINTSNSNLPSNNVIDIVFDVNQSMWLGTNEGISKMETESGEIINYNKADGIDYAGCFIRVDDYLLVGSYGGYSMFHPDSIQFLFDIPKVYFTDFKVRNQDYQLKESLDYVEHINLSYTENFFSFGFTSPALSRKQKIQFAYKLDGLDEDWIYAEKSRQANYTNLNGGNYLFRVKARNRDGEWGETRAISIFISTPFWETWWFYSLCGLLVIASGLIFYKIRIRILKHRSEMETQALRFEAMQKRLLELNATPPDINLNIEDLNDKLKTPLSEREFEVLKLSLDAKTNTEIGEELFITTSTVKFHLRNTYGKLGVNNRKEALDYVIKVP